MNAKRPKKLTPAEIQQKNIKIIQRSIVIGALMFIAFIYIAMELMARY